MRQSTTAFMDKLLEENQFTPSGSNASMAEKVGQQMEKAAKEMTQKYEDQAEKSRKEPEEPETTDVTDEPEGADEPAGSEEN
jgi:hypothetical protein